MRANTEIDALLAKLLESGVSPKYLARLASELHEHREDLEAEARRFGVPVAEVASDAQQRLGSCAVIAKEFERRPELKSWINTSRWLEQMLRPLAAAYILARAPVRGVAAGQAAILRYAAATAAGAGVTFGLLLLLALTMSPDAQWGTAVIERAGALLGPSETLRQHRLPDTGRVRPPSAPPDTNDGAADTALDNVPAAHDLAAIIRFQLEV